jgi:hypothetical protein
MFPRKGPINVCVSKECVFQIWNHVCVSKEEGARGGPKYLSKVTFEKVLSLVVSKFQGK